MYVAPSSLLLILQCWSLLHAQAFQAPSVKSLDKALHIAARGRPELVDTGAELAQQHLGEPSRALRLRPSGLRESATKLPSVGPVAQFQPASGRRAALASLDARVSPELQGNASSPVASIATDAASPPVSAALAGVRNSSAEKKATTSASSHYAEAAVLSLSSPPQNTQPQASLDQPPRELPQMAADAVQAVAQQAGRAAVWTAEELATQALTQCLAVPGYGTFGCGVNVCSCGMLETCYPYSRQLGNASLGAGRKPVLTNIGICDYKPLVLVGLSFALMGVIYIIFLMSSMCARGSVSAYLYICVMRYCPDLLPADWPTPKAFGMND